MVRMVMLVAVMLTVYMAYAETYSFCFDSTPLPQALQKIMEGHPDLDINFIYNELENYATSATVKADNPHDALRQAIGLNPVTVVKSKNTYYVEALQHGEYEYTGCVVGTDGDPLAAATVMLLAPQDSAVLTFAIADDAGRFRIPCDQENVIAKISCIGYETHCHKCEKFCMGTIIMREKAIRLEGIKVEAENAHLYPDRSVFIPTMRQKNAAQDAVDLLRQMALPLIRINPVTNAVTDNAGGGVSLYVNSLEASAEELSGMRMSDVVRVEYLEYPSDPRFHGAKRVINFIMREYEYGGYTKISANEQFLAGFDSRSNIFTRVNFKKMVYDVFVGANNENNHHKGNSSQSTYKLASGMLNRYETLESSHYKMNEYPVTLRATHNADKVQIRNQIGFTNSSEPVNEYQGKLAYNQSEENDVRFVHRNPNHSNSISYHGWYFFAFPKDYSLSFYPRLNYTHLNDNMLYSISANDLQRFAKENAVDYRGDLFMRKNIGQKHSLMLGLNHGGNINRVNYEGAQRERDKFNMTFSAAQTGYQLNSDKYSLYVDAGYAWETNNINNQHKNDSYPFTHISINVTPSKSHQFNAFFQLASTTPMLSLKSSNIVQENEVLYLSGNPGLKACRLTTVNLGYAWMPNNSFGMNIYGFCESYYNRMVAVYEPFRGGAAIMRSYVNDGDWLTGEMGVSVNWKPLNGALQIYASPRLSLFKSTGRYRESFVHFPYTLQATYYLNRIYIQAFWESREKRMDDYNSSIFEGRNFHSLIFGWSDAKWNLRVGVKNVFNRGWKAGSVKTTSPYFTGRQIIEGTSYHPSIQVSATYVIGYGKKVKDGNEVGAPSGAASAIIK